MASVYGRVILSSIILGLPYCLTLIVNINKAVPQTVQFDCAFPTNGSSISMLYKDGKKLVTATIYNDSITDDSDAFSVLRGDSVITFQLDKSSLSDKGLYTCVNLDSGTEVEGNKYSLTLFVITNINKVVPETVQFDCAFPANGSTISMLYKNGKKLVTATFSWKNDTITDDSDAFSVLGGHSMITFQLDKSSLSDEGSYKCVNLHNGREVNGNEYHLTMFALPTVKLNVSNMVIFGGESRYIGCEATGKPKPSVQWIYPKDSGATSSQGVLMLKNVLLKDTGIYQCKAVNDKGIGSKNLTVTILSQYPRQPVLELKSRGESSITLKWKSPVYLGRGGNLQKFVLRCAQIGFEKNFTESQLEHTLNQLIPATKYTFSLFACNDYVCGLATIKVFETAERGKPTNPKNLKAEPTDRRSAIVTWVHGTHSGPVLYTTISYWVTYGIGRNEVKLENRESEYEIKNLTPYTDYTVAIATCVQGQLKVLCSDSSEVNFKTKIAAPSRPNILRMENTKTPEIAICVKWTEPLFFNGPNVSYKVHYKESTDTNWISNDVRMPKKTRIYRSLSIPNNYVIANVGPITIYDVRISARNAAGSNYSETKSIRTDESAPLMPRNLTKIKATADSLTISWMTPKKLLVPIDCYLITVQDAATLNKLSLSTCAKMQITIRRLAENTSYVVGVSATVRRKRDNVTLEGDAILATFRTAIQANILNPPDSVAQKSNSTLILATILSLLLVVIVIFAALMYCKKKKVFETRYGETKFYVEEFKRQSLASRLSQRSDRKQPIPVEDFPDHVMRLHADSDYLFSEEYLCLGPSKPDFTWEHSTLHLNRAKNRYQDIVAYDHSRVRLMSIDGIPASNYINANFIDGFEKKPAYIATQAPLNKTIEDFWRMVWEHDVGIIVMLTNLWERGKRKCDQYWPQRGEIMYGNVSVRTVEERKYACYVHRVFSISWNNNEEEDETNCNTEGTKLVRQFHFTDWPDFGVPRETSTTLSFVHMVRRYMQETDSPTIVHCSAGVGRSGTFIVIESQIERINRKNNVNIYNYIKHIRTQRNFLVQQEVQYVFIHDALVDYIKCGVNAIPVLELEDTLENNYFTPQPENGLSVIDEEWQIINEFCIHEFEMLTGRRPCNQQKNRDTFILPIDSSRVRMTVKGATDGTDYINANYIDGFHKKKSFIVTQMPLYDTIEDFWRMIWENFSEIIVSLLTDAECEKQDLFSYLPRSDCNPINFGGFEIRTVSVEYEDNYRVTELELVGRVEWGESEKRKLFHYQYFNWSENELPVADHLFEMIDSIKDKKQTVDAADSSPVVVHCSCGVGRSGVYCALNNIKEQMDDYEETVDVFTTVRLLRSQRPLIIQSKEHYEYLYRAALRYKELSPKYVIDDDDASDDASRLELPPSPTDRTEEHRNLIGNMEGDNDSESNA